MTMISLLHKNIYIIITYNLGYFNINILLKLKKIEKLINKAILIIIRLLVRNFHFIKSMIKIMMLVIMIKVFPVQYLNFLHYYFI